MPKALILVADGSEEIEFVTPYDGKLMLISGIHIDVTPVSSLQLSLKFRLRLSIVLTRAGFTVQSAGVNLNNQNYAQ